MLINLRVKEVPMNQHTSTPPNVRPNAVLDQAHIGDIKGALGTIAQHDTASRKGWKARLIALFAIMGPGLITMIGDNDAGGIATYSQAGQNYGTSLLWVLFLLIPVLVFNQEMVVRLGSVTGVGHARLIFERFGRFWGWFSVGDLFILNFLTIVTEFIGISLAMSYFGLGPWISVPLSAALLIVFTTTGSFRRWERFMLIFVVINFVAVPLVILSHPNWGQAAMDTIKPHILGGLSSDSLLLIIAMVGTTVAPWQLFFQQSNIVDKRITPRWIPYERADTFIGAVLTVIGAAALIIAAAFVFKGTSLFGHFTDAGVTTLGFAQHGSKLMGTLFAIALLNASLVGAGAVTLSTSYAFGDTFKTNHSLHHSYKNARFFYNTYILMVLGAAGIVLIPQAPLGLITTAVQALAGVLLPSASAFLLLLCNDKQVLGPWANRPITNVLGALIVGTLVVLSFILAIQTLFPSTDPILLLKVLGSVLLMGLLGMAVLALARRKPVEAHPEESFVGVDASTWRMLPITELKPHIMTPQAKISMGTLRLYLVVVAGALIVKLVQLALHH